MHDDTSDLMHPEQVLDWVCHSIDALIKIADRHNGLFPSAVDRDSLQMLDGLPDAIPGQRDGDRCHLGSNLIHDQTTLLTMYGLSEAIDRPDYRRAADRYLSYFANECTATETGLFPWGEHSFWHLSEQRVGSSRERLDPSARGNAIHDHLRQAPVWLWEKLQAFNPECVQRFADGLDYHWTQADRSEYIRHAHIEKKQHLPCGARSCDFPRHGGFYLLDWAYAASQSGANDRHEEITAIMDYWWERRDGRGLLLIESRSPPEDTNFYNVNAPGQTLSLSASMLESIPLLTANEPALAREMENRAKAYVDGFFQAPHEPEEGVFAILSRRDDNRLTQSMPVWGRVYGVWPASYPALTALCAYRILKDERLLDWAMAVGKCYIKTEMPQDVAIPAMDAGLGLGLLADLYDLTNDPAWRDAGMRLATRIMDRYCDGVLPRGAAGVGWYESQMGPCFLIHGLARMALLAQNREACTLVGDYTAR